MNYKYYSFYDVAERQGSDTEKIFNALCILVPEMKEYINTYHDLRLRKTRLMGGVSEHYKMFATGLYVMRNVDNKIVCVAVIEIATIKRIITLPQYRRQGFATHLIKHIADKMIEKRLFQVNSPVSPHIEPLFEKLGWVRDGEPNRDGSQTFRPPTTIGISKKARNVDVTEWIRHLASII